MNVVTGSKNCCKEEITMGLEIISEIYIQKTPQMSKNKYPPKISHMFAKSKS